VGIFGRIGCDNPGGSVSNGSLNEDALGVSGTENRRTQIERASQVPGFFPTFWYQFVM
jgi:hypothetical protein